MGGGGGGGGGMGGGVTEMGGAPVCTPVSGKNLVSRLLLQKKTDIA